MLGINQRRFDHHLIKLTVTLSAHFVEKHLKSILFSAKTHLPAKSQCFFGRFVQVTGIFMAAMNSDGNCGGRQTITDCGHRFNTGIIPFIPAVYQLIVE
ncbi:MAG: hypothetical protein GY947_04250 [Rhodobacteraceae bacterium]|nr:hypothetical protein [Paracoccaceae bacterium]